MTHLELHSFEAALLLLMILFYEIRTWRHDQKIKIRSGYQPSRRRKDDEHGSARTAEGYTH
jgi:hypothetical protein